MPECASEKPRNPALDGFLETQGHDIADYVSEMSDCGTVGKLKAIILSRYASESLRWRAFWKLNAIIFPKYASKMSDWRSLERLKAMTLSE